MPNVFIVLSTYQGEAYLADLLASVRSQTFRNWTLLARDDDSTDSTRIILAKEASADGRVEVLPEDNKRLGAFANFALLLHTAYDRGADVVFLADQDDLWHADKLARLLDAMEDSSRQRTEGGRKEEPLYVDPCLAYCDARVIDGRGKLLAASFLKSTRLPYRVDQALPTLLGRSFVLGCACAVNRALLDFALPIPEQVASHDWWLALCAASVGEIVLVDAPLLDYRRHAGNHSATAFGSGLLFRPQVWRIRWRLGWQSFQRSLQQAALLDERLQQRGPNWPSARETLRTFLEAIKSSSTGLHRVTALYRLGLPRLDWRRKLMYWFCVTLKGLGIRD
jgi:glycosyltransferase involved in cell wall biosynthesis